MRPWEKTPPVAWWELWPANGSCRRNPADGFPLDGKHFLAMPFCNHDSIGSNESREYETFYPYQGWSVSLRAILMVSAPNLRLSLTTSGGRKLIDGGSSYAFGGGLPGKSWVEYKYLLRPNEVLSLTVENEGSDSVDFSAVAIGFALRGTP